MMHKEFSQRSFFLGTPRRLASSLFLSFALPSFPLPVAPWPPSLIPTGETTSWTGECVSCLVVSEAVEMNQREVVPVVFPALRFRETVPLGARARAPPFPVPFTPKRDGRRTVLYKD
jgi:hypothetical protein